MTWYATAWGHMETVRSRLANAEPAAIAKAIDDSYPYSQRSGWAYKAWLEARRDFFRKYNLPLRRSRKPAPDLLQGAQP